jgi:hypothetical protein
MKLGGTLDRLRSDPVAFRKLLLRSFGGATVLTGLAAVILFLVALTSSESLADRLAWAAVVFAGTTLLLAGIAAVVALLAYAVSTGLPDIQLCMRFPFSAVNNPKFEADAQDDGRLKARQFKQVRAELLLRNKSSYSAKNPAVIVRMNAMVFVHGFIKQVSQTADPPLFLEKDPLGEWVVIGYSNTNGTKEVQWDGGLNFSIHGNSTRRLPDLELYHLTAVPEWGTPEIIVEILADGYRKVVSLPADFTVDDESRFPLAEVKPEWI